MIFPSDSNNYYSNLLCICYTMVQLSKEMSCSYLGTVTSLLLPEDCDRSVQPPTFGTPLGIPNVQGYLKSMGSCVHAYDIITHMPMMSESYDIFY